MRPYRVVVRVKNNRLWRAIKQAFPLVLSQSDAAGEIGITGTSLGVLLNMKKSPISKIGKDRWTLQARRVAEAVGESPEYLFDPALYGAGPIRAEVEVQPRQLADVGLLALPSSPDEVIGAREDQEVLDKALSKLPPRERRVLTERFGLDDGWEKPISEISDGLAVSTTRVRQIQARALRKLRHPSHALRSLAR